MSNNQDWQRRTDEWIEATNESRKRKEKRLLEKLSHPTKPKENEQDSKSKKP